MRFDAIEGADPGMIFAEFRLRFTRRFRCTKCKQKDVWLTPDWRDYEAVGMAKSFS